MAGERVEFVDVPYGDSALPPLFLPAETAGPAPCIYGARDRQIPRDQGQKTFDAARNASRRELVLIDDEGGGVEHCSNDNLPRARAIVCDSVADVLGAR